MNSKTKERKTWHKFAIALLAVGAVALATLLVPALSDGGMYFLFLTAIIFSALHGDTRSGAFAAVISIVVNFLLLNHLGKSPQTFGDWLVLFAFGLASGFTVFICHAQMAAEYARFLAESRYRAIFEDAITGIYETTVEGRYVAANPKLAEMFGYDSSEQMILEAENLNRRFYVEPGKREVFARLVAENENLAAFESEIYRRDGAQIWITENAVAVRDRSGKLIGFQGTTIEITDRKLAEFELRKAREELEEKVAERTSELAATNEILRAEITERKRTAEALRRSEEKFRNLVEAATDWIWETDARGVYTYASPQIKSLIGYEPEEIVGKRPFDLMPPEEAARVKNFVRQLTAEKRGFALFESVQQHRNGSLITTETSAVPFYDDAGKLLGSRGIARDITERNRAEIALRESELRLRSVVTAAPVILFALDGDGIFTLSEGKGLDFLGLKAGEVVGQPVFELYADVPEIIADVKRALSGENFTNTVKIGELYYESRYTPTFDETGAAATGLIGVSIDITSSKRIETELLASQKQLRALSGHLQIVREEERKEIARELHDELGQTLTALKIEVVRLGEKGGAAKRNLSPAELQTKVSSMLSIVDGAMDTTRKIVAQLRPGVLDELGLAAAMEWQTSEFQKRTRIKCRLEIEFDEAAACMNLKTTVFRILQECLTNIARHSGAKNAQIKLRDEGFRIFFEVEDDGRGINGRETGNQSSFGILGMRERALLLNGKVEISRVEPTGTRVSVAIPRPAAPD